MALGVLKDVVIITIMIINFFLFICYYIIYIIWLLFVLFPDYFVSWVSLYKSDIRSYSTTNELLPVMCIYPRYISVTICIYLFFSCFYRFLCFPGQVRVFPWEWCKGCVKVYSRQDNSNKEVPRNTTAASLRGEAGLWPAACFPHHQFFFFPLLPWSWDSCCSYCCLYGGHWGPQGRRGPTRGGETHSTTAPHQQRTIPHR